MVLVIFWTIKILAWVGIIFSAYSVIQPGWMQLLFIKSFQWKMKCFGFKGIVEPTPSAPNYTRIWSIVMGLIFFGINYAFGNIFTLVYVLKK